MQGSMDLKSQFIVFLAISLLPLIASINCNRSCRDKSVPFPFGFSPACEIQLNCSASGDAIIGEFPVRTLGSDEILIYLQAKCNRSLHSFRSLFSQNFAPTTGNGILLRDCAHPVSPCMLPSSMVQAHFKMLDCGSANSSDISCYSEKRGNGFIDFDNLTSGNCRSLYSAISIESFNSSAMSLEVQVVQLEWWLQGDCDCSRDANCTKLVSPADGKRRFRCRCKEGFEGDGFRAGQGCRKATSACNPSKYISGQCGGVTRVAVLIGGISLIVSMGLICCFLRRHSALKTKISTKRRLSEATGNCTVPIYAYKDIEKATNSFAEKQRLGTGAYGTVYAGKLHSNDWVAIKRIRHRDADCIEQVMNEIKLLSSVNHPNLVHLLGCSIENGEQILVYEFMPNGTLSQHLQRERGNGLPWPIRLTIASETAQAIAHLHSANPPIYHRDIKSSNILLDYDFRSKVADFGLSRLGMTELSHISTAPQGTPGYLDPQYHQNFHLSDKSDVYSFGVVLVEIITALKAVDFSRPQNEVTLASLATERIGKGCLDEVIDPLLEAQGDAWTFSTVHKVAELAFRCLAFHQDMRPSMMEVAAELEHIRISRWAIVKENIFAAVSPDSSSTSSCSSSSSASEKPLNVTVDKVGLESRSLFALQSGICCVNSMEREKDNSPVCVQDPWLSEQSSPSSNSLLSNAV
ncbi:wall-associated receptor kinase-like 14 isoform X2 [Malania oleifera]|uniref:wall-associated receptor kinase-like 14 isoform X2 n=1 Tax=Malania oleifera TaxID=397392 RepID=UPI0025AE7E31|nr:wall-associated receptor kinase-like 14 isoform X2 [Malania oleifera]